MLQVMLHLMMVILMIFYGLNIPLDVYEIEQMKKFACSKSIVFGRSFGKTVKKQKTMLTSNWQWFFRIKSLICGIIAFIVLLMEVRNRAIINIDDNKQRSVNIKYLRYTSMIAIYCCIFNCIFILLIRIPLDICNISVSGCLITFTLRNSFIGIYQVIRLRYCFSPKLNIKKIKPISSNYNYGYSTWIFISCYGYGFILSICILMAFIFIPNYLYPNTYSLDNYGFGCDWNVTKEQTIMILSIGICIVIPGFIIVLLMYIHKLNILKKNQLKLRRKKQNNIKQYKNIDFLLRKIIILSILYIIPLLCVLICMAYNELKFLNLIIGDLDPVISVFIIYFMMEHNKNDYIKCCNIIKWVFCCLQFKHYGQINNNGDKHEMVNDIDINYGDDDYDLELIQGENVIHSTTVTS